MRESFFPPPGETNRKNLISANSNDLKRNLLVYYHNTSGLRSKLQQFSNNANISVYDVIILTETNFQADITNCEIHLPNYNIFRVDRDLINCSKSSGGGVLIAARKTFNCQLIYTNSRIDELYVLLSVNGAEYILGSVYIPPNSSQEIYSNHCETVDRLCLEYPNNIFLICGDFNRPAVEWDKSDYGLESATNIGPQARTLIDCYEIHDFRQVNPFPNGRGVFLDLFFTQMENIRVSLADECLTNNSIHHPAFCLELNINVHVRTLHTSEVTFDFSRGNYDALNNFFNDIDWDMILYSKSIDFAVQEFYNVLYAGMKLFVPTKLAVTGSSSTPAWFTKELLTLIKKKKAAHMTFKRTNKVEDYNLFSDIRRSCKKLNEELYNDYISNLENNLVRNPRFFWTYTKNLRMDRGLPSELSYEDVRLTSALDIANAFATHFQSSYVLPKTSVNLLDSNVNTINNVCAHESLNNFKIEISLEEVFSALSGLSCNHSIGPDNISSTFLKSCVCSLSLPIYKIFNRSLSEGLFPSLWKESFIKPIHKSGKRDIVDNYRGVCLQSILSKLLDKLVAAKVSSVSLPLITERQHGFFKGRSTTSNLLEYSTFISDALEKGCQVDAIYTDFAKAFDRVSHIHLINKLELWGFPKTVISWFNSFLTERIQRVKLAHTTSKAISVHSGVPQGSHCGPLLFLIFINDIVNNLSNSCLLFADDVKLFRIITSVDDCLKLQKDLNNILTWCEQNSLFLNTEKCHAISFTKKRNTITYNYSINSTKVSRVNVISDLGVIFTSHFSFKVHIFSICNKARRMWGFIRRTCGVFNVHVLKILYVSLVRSILEFSSSVWSPFYNCDIVSLERVQNHFLRHMEFKLGMVHIVGEYSNILNILNLQTLESRRLVSDLCFLHKLLNNNIDSKYLLSKIEFSTPRCITNTRSTTIFVIPFKRTNYGYYSPVQRMIRAANSSTHLSSFHLSFDTFKNRVKIHYSN